MVTRFCGECGQRFTHRRYESEGGCVIIFVGCVSPAMDCDQSIQLAMPLPSELAGLGLSPDAKQFLQVVKEERERL